MTTSATITDAWVNRTLPDIFYEEPEPVEDGMLQAIPMAQLYRLLNHHYEGRDNVFISGNGSIFISYEEGNGNSRVAPDLFIAFGVNVAEIRERLPNFWVWEIGKVPDLVIEVASPSTASRDLWAKRQLYQDLGIPEYWRFDPSPGALLYGRRIVGDRLVNGEYVPYDAHTAADGSVRSRSELLDLYFAWSEARGFDVLDPVTGRTIDPLVAARERARVLTVRADREAARADAEAARANAAEVRADYAGSRADAAESLAESEAARADAAEARARELEAELRRLQEGR